MMTIEHRDRPDVIAIDCVTERVAGSISPHTDGVRG